MSESVLPGPELDREAFVRLVGEDKIRGAKMWREENMRIWQLAVQRLKREAQAEAAARLERRKQEILDRICRQFNDLQRTSGRDIDAYVQRLPSEKQAIVAAMRKHSSKFSRKRSPKARPGRERIAPNPDAFSALLTRLADFGVDVASMLLLSDGCFLYRGHTYVVGNPVQMETRNAGHWIQGVLAAVTSAEMDISFKDGTIVTVSREDLETRTVVIMPAD